MYVCIYILYIYYIYVCMDICYIYYIYVCEMCEPIGTFFV